MSIFDTVCFQVTFMYMNEKVLIWAALKYYAMFYHTSKRREVLSIQTKREEITFSSSHLTVMLPLALLAPTFALIFSVSHHGSGHLKKQNVLDNSWRFSFSFWRRILRWPLLLEGGSLSSTMCSLFLFLLS